MSIDPKHAAEFLAQKDDLNKLPDLGKARSFQSEISLGADSHWKILPTDFLTSRGYFYPSNIECAIRSATTDEIRHWSTIDEYDRIDIEDKLNFILEKCCNISIKNGRPFNFNDLCQIDRFYIVFRIHELTFPNKENLLVHNLTCNKLCKPDEAWKGEVPITSALLRLFDMPSEVMKWYSDEHRCFVINSAKLNESFNLYMPTVGTNNKVNIYKDSILKSGQKLDKSFYKVLPYLISDWRIATIQYINELYFSFKSWHPDKFKFITLFSEYMISGKQHKVSTTCPKCKSTLENPIFSKFSFTIRDLFFFSSRLDLLV